MSIFGLLGNIPEIYEANLQMHVEYLQLRVLFSALVGLQSSLFNQINDHTVPTICVSIHVLKIF
jgi:hypothetical protein